MNIHAKMTKLEEVRAVYASRNACIKDGAHACGGNCFSMNAPRYAYNGGPDTPESRLRDEALAGDAEAMDALLALTRESGLAEGLEQADLVRGLIALGKAGPGHVLAQEQNGGRFYVCRDGDVPYPDSTTTSYGSAYAREFVAQTTTPA